MKIFADGKLFDEEKELVAIVFESKEERLEMIEHLSQMSDEATVYGRYPNYEEEHSHDEVISVLKAVKEGIVPVNEPKN